MSTQQDFDRLLKERMDNLGLEPTESKWLQLQAQLNVINKQVEPAVPLAWYKRNWVRGIAASIALLISIAIGAKIFSIKNTHQNLASKNQVNNNNVTTEHNKQSSTGNSKATKENTTKENTQLDNKDTQEQLASNKTKAVSKNDGTTNSNQTVNNKAVDNNKNVVLQSDKQQTKANNLVSNNEPSSNKNLPVKESKNTNIKNNSTNKEINTIEQKEAVAKNNNEVLNTEGKEQKPNIKEPIKKQAFPFELQEKPRYVTIWPKNAINIIAGAAVSNIGTKASTYNVGASMEKKVSNRVFLEGMVAYASNNPTSVQNALYASENARVANTMAKTLDVNTYNALVNNTTNSTTNTYGINPTDMSFRAGGNNIPVEELSSNDGIDQAAAYRLASQQVEIAPMVGYRITPRISLAAGADVARLIRSNKYNEALTHLSLINKSAISTNNWDAGALAKVECTLGKRYIVGVRHREGLTNTVVNSTSNTRRGYTGVVVKVKIH